METNNKIIEEKILQGIFSEDDYNIFLDTIKDNEEEIEKVNNSPIDNYEHNENLLIDKKILSNVYKPLKFYLEKNSFYSPKMQEGLALCASKIAVLKYFNAYSLESYVKVSYFYRKGSLSNPFEEIFKLILLSLKNESMVNDFKSKTIGNYQQGKLSNDSKIYCQVLEKALNKNKFDEFIRSYTKECVIDDISDSLELSTITSDYPMSATNKENSQIIINQLERIETLHNKKLENEILLGEIQNESYYQKLITNFTNAIIYTKRNIGVYEKTKRLSD